MPPQITQEQLQEDLIFLESQGAGPRDLERYARSVGISMREIRPRETLTSRVTGQPATRQGLQTLQRFVSPSALPPPLNLLLPSPTEESQKIAESPITPEKAARQIGGIIGTAATPVGRFGKLSLGAGLGGAAGEAALQLGQRAGIFPGEFPQTSGQAAKRIGKAGAIEAGFTLPAEFGIRGLQRFMAPRLAVKPEAERLVPIFEKFEGRFTPAQATESSILDIAENIAKGSITGRGRFIKFAKGQQEAIERFEKSLVDDVVGQTSQKLSDAQRGELVVDAIVGGNTALKKVAQKQFSLLDDFVKNRLQFKGFTTDQPVKFVQLQPLKQIALKSSERFGKSQQTKGLLQEILNLDDVMTWENAQVLRSDLLSTSRSLQKVAGEERAAGLAGKFAQNVDEAMEKAVLEIDPIMKPELLRLWRRANRLWKFGKETFNNDFIRRLISDKKTAERVGETIFRTGNVTEIKKVRRALRNAARFDKSINFDDTWKNLQQGYLESILTSSENPGRQLKNFMRIGKKARTLNEVFTPEQIKQLDDFATTSELITTKTAGPGTMLVQLRQGGALVDLAGAVVAGGAAGGFGADIPTSIAVGAGAFLIAPNLLARMITNPTSAKWLTTGLTLPVTSQTLQKTTAIGLRILDSYKNAFKENQEQKINSLEGNTQKTPQ